MMNYIYIASNRNAWPDYWKIGRAHDPIKRIHSFNIASPFRDYVLNATYPIFKMNVDYIEKELHRSLSDYSTNVLRGRRTEWFGEISWEALTKHIAKLLRSYKEFKPSYIFTYKKGILQHRGADEGIIHENRRAEDIVNSWSYDQFRKYIEDNKLAYKPLPECGGRHGWHYIVVKHLQDKLDKEK